MNRHRRIRARRRRFAPAVLATFVWSACISPVLAAYPNLPSSEVIPAGYSSVTFTVTTATVSTTVNATVTGAAISYTTGTCDVTITP